MNFVNLHCHTGLGSPYDGLDTPKELVTVAIEKGMNSLAITEHGNLNSLQEFVQHVETINKERALKDEELFKPIYGMEAYYIEDLEAWKAAHELLDTWKAAKAIKRGKKATDTSSEDITDIELEDISGWLPVTITHDELRRCVNTIREKRHLLLLAKNPQGLMNLYKLCSYSHDDTYFYRFPRIDWNMLVKYHEGLICSTACLHGLLGTLMFQEPKEAFDDLVARMNTVNVKFKELFGADYYNEIQFNSVVGQDKVNAAVITSAGETDIKVIVTVDTHFPRPEQWKTRQMYSKMKWLSSSTEVKADWPESPDDLPYQLWLKDGNEVKASAVKYWPEFPQELVDEFIENTLEIDSKIELFYPDRSMKLPSFAITTDDPFKTLRDLTYEGLERLGFNNNETYIARVEHELDVINFKGFTPYFLTMLMVTDRARSRMVCGCARGSSGSSLVAYCLGIIELDPIQFGLDFSRFLTKGTKGFPDIDFDVAEAAEFKQQLIAEWGKERVVFVSNWTRLQIKNLLKDISKFFEVPYQEVNLVTSKIEMEIKEEYQRLKKEIESEREEGDESDDEYLKIGLEHLGLSESYCNFADKYPAVHEHIQTLLGQVRGVSTHAGGIIIGDDLYASMPLIRQSNKMQTPWPESGTVKALEHMGQIKFDVLGLGTLRMIQDCIRFIVKDNLPEGESVTFEHIRTFYEQLLSPKNLDLNDLEVWNKIFGEGYWLGVFQFTSKGAQEFARAVRPQNIDELAAITSIYRPGPMAAGVHEAFAQVKAMGNETYYNDIHKTICGNTFGFLVFQEQLAALVSQLGKGITTDEGHYVRKLLTSKGDKQRAEAETYREKFLEGCKEKGMTLPDSSRLWNDILMMAGYAFNKAHAVAYSLISYMCGWLATHFPLEWAAAYLNKDLGKPALMERNISKVRSYGFNIRTVDINVSGTEWLIDGNDLVQPLTSVKGLGEKVATSIMSHRPIKYFSSFIDGSIPRNQVNKRSLGILVKAKALDEFFCQIPNYRNRQQLLHVIENCEYKNADTFYNALIEVDSTPFTKAEEIDQQYALTGVYPIDMVITSDDLEILKSFKDAGLYELPDALESLDDIRIWFVVRDFTLGKTVNGKSFCKCTISDYDGTISNLTIWTDKKNPKIIQKHCIYSAPCKKDWQGISTVLGKVELLET
jgi:DNA polymerase-3 subunit alpha